MPDYWPAATRALARRDKVFRKLIKSYPGIHLSSRGDAFGTLARAIVGQQISIKAADSVWRKVMAEVSRMEPALVFAKETDALRACGLSRQKALYLQDLARHFVEGVLDERRWAHLDDEEIIRELVQVKGVGRWSAEMFLIFYLLRPNVLPLDDMGLQRAIQIQYNGGEGLAKSEMREIAAAWEPWRTVATWYLWRSLEPVPVEY